MCVCVCVCVCERERERERSAAVYLEGAAQFLDSLSEVLVRPQLFYLLFMVGSLGFRYMVCRYRV